MLRPIRDPQTPASAPVPVELAEWTPPSWEELVRDHSARVYRLAYRLTGNRRTAKVSKQPGRTQLLNFFDVPGTNGRLVDLPGYGYAQAGKSAQAAWQQTVNDYLNEREALAGVVLVMDIRHPLQPFDIELIEWADPSGLPLRILLNKADKLKRGAQGKVLQQVRNAVKGAELTSVQVFSASTGQGLPELVSLLTEWLGAETETDDQV